MTNQLTLALADRHAGQAANLAAGQKPYRDDRHRVEVAVADLIRSGVAFTADSVHALVLREDNTPYDRNLVSSVLGVHAQHGDIVEVLDRRAVPSVSRSRKGSRNKWWRGHRTQRSAAA